MRRWPVRRTRPSRTTLAALAAGGLVVCASGTGVTYAAFSDADRIKHNTVRAAHVALGIPGPGAGPELKYTGLLPGVAQSRTVSIAYRGSIPADIALEVRPEGASAYCVPTGADTWGPKPGGSVQISFGGDWLDYCGLLSPNVDVPVRADVAPDTDLSVSVSVRLAPGTDYPYSLLTDTDRFTVTAAQASLAHAGFTDFAVGTIEIGTGLIGPAIPAECGPAGRYRQVVVGTESDDVINAGNGKQIILGLGGNDRIDGGNAKDCLVGGEGDDVLLGANGKDVMIGGAGFDTCDGARAPDYYSCELTAEQAPTTPTGPPVDHPTDGPSDEPSTHPDPPTTQGPDPDPPPTRAPEPDPPATLPPAPDPQPDPGPQEPQPPQQPSDPAPTPAAG